jgi:hypothetical protein
LQLVHAAVTSGPRRLPQTSGLPLELEELADVELDDVVPEPPPHTLVLGTQSSSCEPFEPATIVHVRSDEHALAVAEQSGAQYWSPPNCPHFEPAAQSESIVHGGHAAAVSPPVPVAFPPCPAAAQARKNAAGAATRRTARRYFIAKRAFQES